MRAGLLALAVTVLAGAQSGERAAAIVSRTSEEAEVFAQMAPNLIAQETFEQRARQTVRRFRPRIGNTAIQPMKPQYRTREIVSEYGYAVFKDSPGQLHEFRQIVSVDGRQVLSSEKARQSLALGIKSGDDRRKKRMVEDFQKHGLTSAAADFGQLILLFTKRGMANFSFQYSRVDRIGTDSAAVLAFKQTGGTGSVMIFEQRKAIRQPLEGELWVRQQDSVPLRIVLRTTRKEGEIAVRDEATVDYAMSAHGVIVPVSVVHRQFANGELAVENTFRYSSFRKFGADAEIKFSQ